MTPTNEAGHGLPELPEWSKRDDLGGLVPSQIRSELRAYARDALALSRGVPAITVAMWEAGRAAYAAWIFRTYQQGLPSDDERGEAAREAIAAMLAAAPAAAGAQGEEYAACCDTPAYCSSVRRCTRMDASPQPAAADGGVRERARALFDAMLAAPYGSTTMGDIVCAETTCNRLESAWLPILETALSSHRQAGGESLYALHSRFLSDTSGLPEEWQDWRNDFARDIRALVEKGAGNG